MRIAATLLSCGLVALAASSATAGRPLHKGHSSVGARRPASRGARATSRVGARPKSRVRRSGQHSPTTSSRVGHSSRPWATIGDIKGEKPRPQTHSGTQSHRSWAAIGDIKGERPRPVRF